MISYYSQEHLARVDFLTFHYSSNNFEKPLLCSAGSSPQELPQTLALSQGSSGLTFTAASTPAEPGRSELLGRLLIPVCQKLTSCPEIAVKTAFSQQASGELGISPSPELTHTVEFHITAGNTLREFREQDKELEAALLLKYTFLKDP